MEKKNCDCYNNVCEPARYTWKCRKCGKDLSLEVQAMSEEVYQQVMKRSQKKTAQDTPSGTRRFSSISKV